MSGPSRELPPLVVKITADSSKLKKGLEDAVKAAKEAADSITKNFGKANLDQIKQRRETLRRLGAVDRAYAKRRMSEDKESRAKAKQASDETAEMRKANQERNKEVERSRKEIEKQARFQQMADKRATSRMWSRKRDFILQRRKDLAEEKATIDAAMAEQRRQVEQSRKNIERQSKQQAADDKRATSRMWSRKRDSILAMREAAAIVDAEEQRVLRRSRIRRRRQIIEGRREAAEQQAAYSRNLGDQITQALEAQRQQRRLADQQAAEEHRQLRRKRMRQVSNLKGRGVMGRKARMAGGGRMGSMMDGMDGGAMMGARADMYMHKQTLGSLFSGIASFLKPAAEMETYAIAIGQFSKSADEAKKTLMEMQEFALISPYSMDSVVQGTSLMMRYGMAADDAVKMTKMLGEVAGGNSAKMELLALAVGQTTSMGKLMGQELRQMTEHGFNPLQIAAEQMLGPNADPKAVKAKVLELSKLMRAGAIDAGLVTAALTVATSKGGKYAGQMEKQSNSIAGLTSQIVESLKVAAAVIGKIFEEDTRKVLKTVLRYVSALIAYLRDPKNTEFIKAWGYFVVKVVAAVAAFHTLGLMLAYVKWMFGSLLTLITFFIKPVKGLIFLFTAMRTASVGAAAGAAMAWIAAGGWIVLAIAGVMAAWVALQTYFHKDGFTGVVSDWMAALNGFIGFFQNFAENIVGIFAFLGTNWLQLIKDMASPITAIAGKASGSLMGAEKQYDTSMFNFGRGSLADGAMNLAGAGPAIAAAAATSESAKGTSGGLLGFLDPYLTDPKKFESPDAPGNIDWKSYLGGGGGGESGMPDAQAAVRRGSSEHAQSIYNYDQMLRGESAAAREEAEKKQREKEKVDLLQQIATNTKIQAGLNSIGSAAGDMVAGFLSGGKK